METPSIQSKILKLGETICWLPIYTSETRLGMAPADAESLIEEIITEMQTDQRHRGLRDVLDVTREGHETGNRISLILFSVLSWRKWAEPCTSTVSNLAYTASVVGSGDRHERLIQTRQRIGELCVSNHLAVSPQVDGDVADLDPQVSLPGASLRYLMGSGVALAIITPALVAHLRAKIEQAKAVRTAEANLNASTPMPSTTRPTLHRNRWDRRWRRR